MRIKNYEHAHLLRDPSTQNVVTVSSHLQYIQDIRESDVIYYTRVTIDKGNTKISVFLMFLDLRVGTWYNIAFEEGHTTLESAPDLISNRPNLRVFAFDIETTKMPLKVFTAVIRF